MAVIQDTKGQINFQINAINAQLRMFGKFPSNDRQTTRNVEALKNEREALKRQIKNLEWTDSITDEEAPF